MYIKNQTFLVLGLSKSGHSVAKYILLNKGKCYLFEENESEKIKIAIEELTALGGKVAEKDKIDSLIKEIDIVVISPGVPINHPVAIKAKKENKRLIGELEFGYLQFFPTVVAITGTNGKTTTVKLIENILNKSKEKCKCVGNVGVPLTAEIQNISKDDILVCEVSSFQLESVNAFCPHISCVLNITPDHLERHYSMDNYSFLKRRILQNQKSSEYTILNYDDEIVKDFYKETKANVIWVSTKEVVDGAYIKNGKLYYANSEIIDEKDLPVGGEHNIYNTLFSIAVCKLLGLSKSKIKEGIISFVGVPNRIELVAEKNEKKYYNDSKATNTASTISAIKTMVNPTVLILGGSEKGEIYDKLFEEITNSKIIHIVLTGASRFSMLASAQKMQVNNITIVEKFNDAIKLANALCVKNGNVLLSPACASFDNFKNYEERGNEFRRIVSEL